MFKLLLRFACRYPQTPRERALAALRSGRLEDAEAAFTTMLEAPALRGSERAFLLNKRGAARARLDRRDTARADFEAALAVTPAYAPALVNLGNLALEAGDEHAAIARYEAAIAADPLYAAAYFNLSVVCKRQGRFEEAVRALRTAQKLERKRRREL